MKNLISHVFSFAFVCFITINAAAQSVIDAYVDRIAKASAPSDIKKIIKSAEKDGLEKIELLDLQYAAYLHVLKLVSDSTLEKEKRNSLAVLLNQLGDDLPAELEKYLFELEATAPQSRDISRLSVRLAQLLSYIPIKGFSQSGKAKIAEQRKERAQELYLKALAVESSLDPHSLDTMALSILLADEYLAAGEIEKALPLYEAGLVGIEKKEGKRSLARIRALYGLAQIADIAGDLERFEVVENELSDFGVSFERTVILNVRTIGDAKGIKGGFGRVKLETTNWPAMGPVGSTRTNGNSSQTSAPIAVRVTPEVNVLSSFGYKAHPAIVTVDHEGNVTNVEVVSPASPSKKIIEMVGKWKFRPLVYNGTRSQMKGLVYCWVSGSSFP
ncbi:MAG: hypothetical protein QUS14_03945 [Pyrinomonadaceae bacterium]|nr:hypothetical protein [Pyrinomonadaceae bacterium]